MLRTHLIASVAAVIMFMFMFVFVAGSCNQLPVGPTVESVEPSSGSNQATTPITIMGQGFFAAARANFDDPKQAGADTGFRVLLGDQPLDAVTYHGKSQLKAVVPAGLSPRTYDLAVVDPWGRRGTLEQRLIGFVNVRLLDRYYLTA
jgi:hypothetical protein